MPTDLRSSFPDWPWIDTFPDRPSSTESYVMKEIAERVSDISSLPTDAREMLAGAENLIIDVGPGEGRSSIALARSFPNVDVLGIEMDRKHLIGAWPECSRYRNLDLVWGAVQGTPANPNVDRNLPLPPQMQLPDGCCDVVFSFLGMSWEDIFSPQATWPRLARKGCVMVVPRFWLAGLSRLPDNEQREIVELARRLNLNLPRWGQFAALPGFAQTAVLSWGGDKKAGGWLLWLSGIFDGSNVYFWDTLVDQWQSPPTYGLPDIRLALDVVVGYK